MANMPVATLRIWEQRHQAVRPGTAPSGHRRYSAADLERVLLLRQLTEQGHAIGSIATLDSAQLQAVASTHASTAAGAGVRSARPAAALRLVVVGAPLAARLQRVVQSQLAGPITVVAVFESLAEAARVSQESAADTLIWQSPALPTRVPPELEAARAAWHARKMAVVYRFASASSKQALVEAGAIGLREPPDDDALGAWLAAWRPSWAAPAAAPPASVAAPEPLAAALPAANVAPRRFDDAALTAIAALPPTMACECPRHVAELLIQLASFEAYSAGCINRSPADAELHAYLQRVAGASRALFESALELVARHERLNLP